MSLNLTVGQTASYTVTPLDSLGHPLTDFDPGTIVWVVDDSTVVSMGPNIHTDLPPVQAAPVTGQTVLLKAVGPGTANVTITFDGQSQQLTIIVTEVVAASLQLQQNYIGTPSVSNNQQVFTLVGPQGPTGPTGATGPQGPVHILSGSGAPSGGTGVDGDYYLNTTNGDFYFKVSGSWVLQMNLTGPQGPAGATGANGAPGATWAEGHGAPGNAFAVGHYHITGHPVDGTGFRIRFPVSNVLTNFDFVSRDIPTQPDEFARGANLSEFVQNMAAFISGSYFGSNNVHAISDSVSVVTVIAGSNFPGTSGNTPNGVAVIDTNAGGVTVDGCLGGSDTPTTGVKDQPYLNLDNGDVYVCGVANIWPATPAMNIIGPQGPTGPQGPAGPGWVTGHGPPALLTATFAASINADFAVGSPTGTSFSGASLSGGWLICSHNGGTDSEHVRFPATGNSTANSGDLSWTVRPAYSGTPSPYYQEFVGFNDADPNSWGVFNNNRVALRHSPVDGHLYLVAFDNTGNPIINFADLGQWSPVAGHSYHMHLHYDFVTGNTFLKIEGTQFGATQTGTGTRVISGSTNIYVGGIPNVSSANLDFQNVTVGLPEVDGETYLNVNNGDVYVGINGSWPVSPNYNIAGVGNAILQNGNAFGGNMVIGTTDAQELRFITSNNGRLRLMPSANQFQDFGGHVILDWDNRILYDGGNLQSLDYNNRQLKYWNGSINAPIADWSLGNVKMLAGGIDANNLPIINAPDPLNPQDVATKNYVDTHGGGGSVVNGGQTGPVTIGTTNNTATTLLANGIPYFTVNDGIPIATLNQNLNFNRSGAAAIYVQNGSKQADFGALTLNYSSGNIPSILWGAAQLADASGNPTVGWSTSGLSFVTVNGGLTYKAGANGRAGIATLSGGSVTVSNTSVTVNSLIFFTPIGAGTGAISLGTVVAGTSFQILSSDAGDSRSVQYHIIESQ